MGYSGNFVNGKAEGKGTIYYESGNINYYGDFKNGDFNGKGAIMYDIFEGGDSPAMYIGDFENGQFNGFGTLYSESGEINIEGEFKDGMPVK